MSVIVALAFLLFGAAVLWWPSIRAGLRGICKRYPLVTEKAGSILAAAANRRKTLKSRVQELNTGQKENFIAKSYKTMSAILLQTGEAYRIRQMKIISAVCGAAGVLFSLYLGSYMLLPILGVGFALLPMWLIKFKAYRYKVSMMGELSVVLSMVTNSYIRSENIVKSVEENLEYMNEPVRSHFEWFVNTCNRVSSNIGGNLEGLGNRIDNRIFHLWCDSLIMCQKDINQKVSLNAIVEQFTTDRELLNLLSAEVTAPIRMFVLVTLGTMLAFPLTVIIGQQFQIANLLELLFTTLPGQCITVGYAISILFGVNRAIDLSTEL